MFSFAQHKIKHLEEELRQVQENEGINGVRQSEILDDLQVQRDRLESIHRQQSQEVWLKEGERNNRFFHASLMMRRRQNRVLAIKEGSNWLFKELEIKDHYAVQGVVRPKSPLYIYTMGCNLYIFMYFNI